MKANCRSGTAMFATSLFLLLLSVLTAIISSTYHEVPFEHHGTLTVSDKYIANLVILLYNVNFDASKIYICKYINVTLYNLNQKSKINIQIHNLRNNSLTNLELYSLPESITFNPPYDSYLIILYTNRTNVLVIYIHGVYVDFPYRYFIVFSLAFLLAGMFLLALYSLTSIGSKVSESQKSTGSQ
jgi:hypothetical protein